MEAYMVLPESAYRNYLERRKVDLSRLQKAFQEGTVEDFKVIGHQLKGNAASFRYEDLGHLGERLESVTTKTLASEGPGLLSEFAAWIHRTQKSFETNDGHAYRANPHLDMGKWEVIKKETLQIWATLNPKDLEDTGGDFESIVSLVASKYDLDKAQARERVIEVLGHFINKEN